MSTQQGNLLIIDRRFFTFSVNTESQIITLCGIERSGGFAAQVFSQLRQQPLQIQKLSNYYFSEE